MGLSTYKGSYQEDFTSETNFNVVHNLGTDTPVVDVWVGGQRQHPLTVTVVDVNTVNITFTNSTSGKVMVA